MSDLDKMFKAIEILRPNTPLLFHGTIINQETFNTIQWDINGSFTTENPYAELTWTAVKAEMDTL